MRRIRVVLAVGVMMAMLLGTAASPAVADDDFDFDFNDGCCGFNDDQAAFFLFPGTLGFSPFLDNGFVFDDVTFRDVRENSPKDDTCVFRGDHLRCRF